MALVLCNTHGELTPLERGMHALKSGMTQRAYAEKVSRTASAVQFEMQAAKVSACIIDNARFPSATLLSAIHAAPEWLCPGERSQCDERSSRLFLRSPRHHPRRPRVATSCTHMGAEKVSRSASAVQFEMQAAKVASCTDVGARVCSACSHMGADLSVRALSEIHAAPEWLWPAITRSPVKCVSQVGDLCCAKPKFGLRNVIHKSSNVISSARETGGQSSIRNSVDNCGRSGNLLAGTETAPITLTEAA
jgi:hypothetical protein